MPGCLRLIDVLHLIHLNEARTLTQQVWCCTVLRQKKQKKAGCEVFPCCSSTSQFKKLCSVVPNLPVSMQTSRRGRLWLRRERGSTTNQTDGALAAC